jgi:hypothetical protein
VFEEGDLPVGDRWGAVRILNETQKQRLAVKALLVGRI